MLEAKVWVRYRKKYKVTTDSNHNKPLFDNVQFKLAISSNHLHNKVWGSLSLVDCAEAHATFSANIV